MENQKLSKAKTNLVLDNVFLASLLLGMEFIQDNSIETFATDGEKILYNENFLESLSISEIQFVLAHEVMHAVFQHMFRLSGRDAELWNQATDYVINDLLTKEPGAGKMPSMG